MKQYEFDIESLKEKYLLEAEKREQEHQHAVELMEIKHRNELERQEKEQSNAAVFGAITNVIQDPSKLQGLLDIANNPVFKKK